MKEAPEVSVSAGLGLRRTHLAELIRNVLEKPASKQTLRWAAQWRPQAAAKVTSLTAHAVILHISTVKTHNNGYTLFKWTSDSTI